jgi:anaerobic magnesium-protoporphyrin IX monomethyl ester cyclase
MATRRKILLLNPPGTLPFGRDYFCSKVMKTGYVEHPVDLLILSGILADRHDVAVLDAVAEKMSFPDCRERILSSGVDAIIFLSGCVSWEDDFTFLREIKVALPEALFIGLGDIFYNPHVFPQQQWIDAYILDFTGEDILRYLDGSRASFRDIVCRDGEKIVKPALSAGAGPSKLFEIPVPRHELFLSKRYSFPFARHLPFTTVLTDFGCGFRCPFCIYSALPFKMRTVHNVVKELEYIHSLGIRELFIKDQTFAFDHARATELCRQMMEHAWNFSWTCFVRANLVTSSLLSTMKEAGCHTVILGVESGNDYLLRKYKPGVTKEAVREAVSLCRKMRISTVATFILGLPEDDNETIRETINFARELGCDFASFNFFVPKPGTVFAQDLPDGVSDQSGIACVRGNAQVSAEQLVAWRRQALKEFYFSPSYILTSLTKIDSLAQLRMMFSSAKALWDDVWKRK